MEKQNKNNRDIVVIRYDIKYLGGLIIGETLNSLKKQMVFDIMLHTDADKDGIKCPSGILVG